MTRAYNLIITVIVVLFNSFLLTFCKVYSFRCEQQLIKTKRKEKEQTEWAERRGKRGWWSNGGRY